MTTKVTHKQITEAIEKFVKSYPKGNRRKATEVMRSFGFDHLVIEPVSINDPQFRLAILEGAKDSHARAVWKALSKVVGVSHPASIVSSGGSGRFNAIPLDTERKKWMVWRNGDDARTVSSLDVGRTVFHNSDRGLA